MIGIDSICMYLSIYMVFVAAANVSGCGSFWGELSVVRFGLSTPSSESWHSGIEPHRGIEGFCRADNFTESDVA